MSRKKGGAEWVSASDVHTYVFCSKAFHLQRVERAAPSEAAKAAMERGVKGHYEHGVSMDRQRLIFRWAWRILALALVILAAGGILHLVGG